jgi:hypothetical protein
MFYKNVYFQLATWVYLRNWSSYKQDAITYIFIYNFIICVLIILSPRHGKTWFVIYRVSLKKWWGVCTGVWDFYKFVIYIYMYIFDIHTNYNKILYHPGLYSFLTDRNVKCWIIENRMIISMIAGMRKMQMCWWHSWK